MSAMCEGVEVARARISWMERIWSEWYPRVGGVGGVLFMGEWAWLNRI